MPVIESLPNINLKSFQAARDESDRLFQILKPEVLYKRPIAERHRVIFYVGHLDGFDAIQIARESLHLKSPDPELDALFQAGIDPDAANLPDDRPSDWPRLGTVLAYRDRCRERVDECLDRASEDAIAMALEHRLMHLETLAYMFHNFCSEDKVGQVIAPATSREGLKNDWRYVPAGTAVLGKRDDGSFGWDNEYPETLEPVSHFRIQRFNVSNGEYLEFVRAGARMPHFWSERDGRMVLRCMFGEVPLPLDFPVYATQTEAAQYSEWMGKDLPSEAQFHRAAYGTPDNGNRTYPWGEDAPAPVHGNFDFSNWDPVPVHSTPAGDSAFGVSQLVGNGWEWTKTVFGPFPGFRPRDSYPGYSANFFDGEHKVMKGASARTAVRLLRPSFRNWFRRDYPYMYASFRCVDNLA